MGAGAGEAPERRTAAPATGTRVTLLAAGVPTSYVSHGAGSPLVLLHGGVVGGECWAAQVPALAPRFRVLVPDRRGHGHTPDVAGPYTYGAMAEETIAFLEQVVDGPADLVGWSDGGNVALHVVRARPDLVRKVVVMGANFHHSGLHPDYRTLALTGPCRPDLDPIHEPLDGPSPDGADHWPVISAKLLALWSTGPTLTVEDLGGIVRPVLVLVGDDDCITYEHTATLLEALPQGQLAVVPGTSHLLPVEKPDLVNWLILDFLTDGRPARLVPLRFGAVR